MKSKTFIRARRGFYLLGLRGRVQRIASRRDFVWILGYNGKPLPAAWATKRWCRSVYAKGAAARLEPPATDGGAIARAAIKLVFG